MTVCILFTLCITGAFAGETDDDEEAQAEREKAKIEKKLAEIKARKAKDGNKDAAKDERLEDDPFDQFKKKEGDVAKPESFVKPDDPKAAVPDANKPEPAAKKEEGLPPCAACLSRRILPNLPYKPYTKFEGAPAPKPDYVAPWKLCDKCIKNVDANSGAASISEDMKARQERAREAHKKFEEHSGKKLAQFETPFVTVRSMLEAGPNKTVADALEKCAGILQNNSKSMLLVATRPDEDQIVIFADEATYIKYADSAFPTPDKDHKEMRNKSSGFHVPNLNVIHMGKPGVPVENKAVFAFAGQLMEKASNRKAKPWLKEGFSSYCENATLGMNTMYRIAYEMNEVKFGKNWNEDVKKLAKDGKLKPWGEIFEIQMEHLKATEYLHCYSIVSFLIKMDPANFDKFVLNVQEGMDAGPAIEKAYSKKVKDLQGMWGQWVATQK